MKMRIIKTVSMLLAICLFATGCLPAMADDLVLPASLKTIGDSAFEGDMSLDEVILQEGVETIGSRAFADTSITHIYLPASLTSLAKDAYTSCSPERLARIMASRSTISSSVVRVKSRMSSRSNCSMRSLRHFF